MFKRLIQSLTGKPATPDAPPAAPGKPTQPSGPTPAAEAAPPELITVYDVHGRELQVTRADWRDRMLLPQIEAQWNDPGELYQLIINALNDEFVAEVEPATKRLLEIDPIVERSHVIRAIVLMQMDQLDEAERVLREAAARVGETGTILTNLAKVQASRGDEGAADATLWKSIALDPNQDNGLAWWLSRVRERDGDTAYEAALGKVAALPGSWRASLHLGRHRLAEGDLPAALASFRTVLARAPQDRDALLTISGDLGNAGKIAELVDLTGPHFDPQVHGPQVGLNLAQAYLHLDRLDEGEAMLERLYALKLPPFKQYLDAMANQYQERRREGAAPRPVEAAGLQIAQMPFELPIWMYGLRDPQWLFAPKPADARRVMFLTLGKRATHAEQAEEQREDDVGRLSRAIPLYLAESAYEWTSAHAKTMVAVVVGGGPVVFGAQDEADERETAAQFAEHADVLVVGSIGRAGDAWTIDLGLWDTARVALIGRESMSAQPGGIEAALLALETRVLARLGGAQPKPHDAIYTRPTPEQMKPYLDALAQSLMLGLVANELMPKQAMWGERNMLEWPLRMALHWPGYEVPRAMYLSGISHASRYQSDVLAEFEERSFALLGDLQSSRSPLAGLEPLMLQAFKRPAVPEEDGDLQRRAWIERVAGA